jgi:hypothetical protein
VKAKNKHILLLFVDLILYSVLLDAIEVADLHHVGPDAYQGCQIRNFAVDFSMDWEAAFSPPVSPFLFCSFLIYENQPDIEDVSALAVGTRAPPPSYVVREA